MKHDYYERREELRNKKRKKSSNKIASIFIIFMVIIMLFLGYIHSQITPVNKNNSNKVKIHIREGEGSSSIVETLYQKKLIKNKLIFKIYAKTINKKDFFTGSFDLSQDMSVNEIIYFLTNKDNAKPLYTLSIIEGDNILKIAEKLEKLTGIKKQDFIDKINDKNFINKLSQKYPELITSEIEDDDIKYKLEGYLYPAKYDIEKINDENKDIESLISQMVWLTNEKVLPIFKKQELVWNISGDKEKVTIHKYITMSSILEKESTKSTDNEKIAGVFLNRLALNMPLQTDPTVYYSLNKTSGELTLEDLKNDSKYNTYVNYGLPPGPICSPGEKSYEAINNSSQHGYLYFLTDKEGKAYFSKTFEEHEQLAKEHIRGYVGSNEKIDG